MDLVEELSSCDWSWMTPVEHAPIAPASSRTPQAGPEPFGHAASTNSWATSNGLDLTLVYQPRRYLHRRGGAAMITRASSPGRGKSSTGRIASISGSRRNELEVSPVRRYPVARPTTVSTTVGRS